jgi:hypothetical protein
MKLFLLACTLVGLLSFIGCGGGTMIAPQSYSISVTVSGLTGSGSLVLQDNSGSQLTFTSNTTQTFSNSYSSGASYSVTVASQPTNETCTAGSNASGTITSNVTISVSCSSSTTTTYPITVSATGLTGTLKLQDNLGDSLSLTSSSPTQTFATQYASGALYTVTIATQPSGQTCTLGGNATGTITGNTPVTATCTTNAVNYTISVLPSGLTGTLVVQDSNGDTLTFSGNSAQTFASSYASGSSYSVTVKTQPSGQTCTLGSNASGTITGNITVAATCSSNAANYTISVLPSGLSGTLVVQDSNGDSLTFAGNTAQTFAKSYASGSTYTVSINTQPSGQTCTLGSNATGTITSNITVTATCVSNYSISVLPSGLTGTLVVQDSKNDTLTFTGNTSQTFPSLYASGSSYTVSVKTQPTGQTCTLSSNASGTITSNITVTATCSSTIVNYTISVLPSGLIGTLVVQDSKSDTLTFTSNNSQTFASTYSSGSTYSVTIKTQPAAQTCTLSSNATGTISSNITVTATCVSNYSISVLPSGLSGTLVVQDSKNDTLTFTGSTSQTFATLYASGSSYTVTITTQPTGQTCTLGSNATGTITSNITVTATCVSNYTITVSPTGLSGSLVVQDSKSDKLTFASNTPQTFASTFASGSTYSVTIQTQPTGQTCTLGSNASGTITSNVTVTATCTNTATYTISVAVSGLTGTLVMQDDKSDNLTFTKNNTQTFATSYLSGSSYTVSVKTQPTGQTCTLSSNASGIITSNITVTATCTTNSGGLTISVALSGLSSGESATFSDDKGDALTFNGNSTLTFASSYTSGATYTVNTSSQPSAQACTPTYLTGTISSNITLSVTCATGATRQLGTISGVSSISCQGSITGGVCQQMTVSCPGVPDIDAYIKTNAPSGTSKGTVTYGTGTDGNGLYESIFTYGSTAVQNVINGGFTTVQISWGTPFNNNQKNGWAQGPGGLLTAACRYATVTKWIYDNIQNNTALPMCATANSGGAGALAYALSQYGSNDILSMAEVTSGPPTGRLDWGCGCTEGSLPVSCGQKSPMGTCFGTADAPVWDPAYNPNASTGVCTAAVNGTLPPGGLNFFLGDSAEAPGATYNFPNTYVNLVFGGQDISSAIPIGQDWFNHITSTSKGQECIADAPHSIANVPDGAAQIATDILNKCVK